MKYRNLQWGGQMSGTIPGVLPATQTQFIPSGQGSSNYSPDLKNFYQPEKAEELKKAGLDADVLKSVMGKGHTNAGNYVIGQAEQAVKQLNQAISQYGNEFLKTEAGKKLANAAVIDYSVINKLERDVKNTENATVIVKDNKAGSAYSMNSDGKLLVKTQDGKYGYVSPQEYLQNKDKFKFMTNSETLQAKDDDPQFTFQDVTNAVTNTVGEDIILQRMKDYTSTVGISGYKSTGEFVDNLQKFGSPEQALGFITSSGGNENNKQQISLAIKAFRDGLDKNVKNSMLAEALKGSDSYEEAVKKVDLRILNFFMKGTIDKTEKSQTLQYSGDYNKSMSVNVGGQKETLKPYGDLYAALKGDNTYSQFGDVVLNDGQYELKLPATNIMGSHLSKDGKPTMIFDNKALIGALNNKTGNRPVLNADGTPIPKDLAKTIALSNTNKASYVHFYPTDNNHKPLPLSQVQKMSEADIKRRVDSGYVTSVMMFDGIIGEQRTASDYLKGIFKGNLQETVKGKILSGTERDGAISHYNQARGLKEGDELALGNSYGNDDIMQAAFMIEMPKDQYGDPSNPVRSNVSQGLSENLMQNFGAEFDKAGGQSALITQELYNRANQSEGKSGVQIDKTKVGNMWQSHSPF